MQTHIVFLQCLKLGMLLICEWKLYARTSSYTISALPLPVLPLKIVPVAAF